jgi:multidrug efflux pump subunit AcrA (membrane-fusion protein)
MSQSVETKVEQRMAEPESDGSQPVASGSSPTSAATRHAPVKKPHAKKKKVTSRRLWIVSASILILCLLATTIALTGTRFISPSRLFASQESEPAIYTARKSSLTVEVPASGELETAAATPISVPNVRTGGLKIFWIIKDGSLVRKGDTLVEFDASELLQQMAETQNNLDATLRQLEATVLRSNSDTGQVATDRDIAEIELDKAHTQAPRDEQIFSRNQIIEGELNVSLYDTKVREYTGKIATKKSVGLASERILVIERKQHESRKSLLEQSLGSLKILAPHDGLVLHQKDELGNSSSIGETRWPGYTLMTIPDLSAMKARVQVLESDAGNLKVGQRAKLTVDSHPDMEFTSTVERIDTTARTKEKDSPVKYFEIILKVEGKSGEVLKPGKLVHASIITAEHADAVVIPKVALVEESLRFYAWVQSPGGPERSEVEVESGDAARVVVRSGISEGDQVLLNPPKQSDVAGQKNKASSSSRGPQ